MLYQYEVCPWCCKVKAVLDFYDIPYKVVEVHPMYKKELKRVSSHKKVPVLFFDDVQVNESDDMDAEPEVPSAAVTRDFCDTSDEEVVGRGRTMACCAQLLRSSVQIIY